jgi:hypothetical protein
LLEEEFDGRMRFRGDLVEVFANDRLLAPNEERTLAELRPHLDALVKRLYPGVACEMQRQQDTRERFAVTIKSNVEVAFADLAGRVLS